MRLLHCRANVNSRVLVGIVFIFSACVKDPVWLAEARALLSNTNREIEEILPALSQQTSRRTFFDGLRRLDTSGEKMLRDLEIFFQKYPNIAQDRITVGLYLRPQLKQLGDNLRKIIEAANYWDKELKHPKEFVILVRSILIKADKASKLLNTDG